MNGGVPDWQSELQRRLEPEQAKHLPDLVALVQTRHQEFSRGHWIRLIAWLAVLTGTIVFIWVNPRYALDTRKTLSEGGVAFLLAVAAFWRPANHAVTQKDVEPILGKLVLGSDLRAINDAVSQGAPDLDRFTAFLAAVALVVVMVLGLRAPH